MSAESLKTLKNKRSAVLGQQTTLTRVVDQIVISEVSIEDIEPRIKYAEKLLQKFDDLQTEIEGMDEVELTKDKRETFTEANLKLQTRLLSILNQLKKPVKPSAPIGNSTVIQNSGANNTLNTSRNSKNVRLPKLELTKFSGKYSEWPAFFSMFQTLVDKDEDLSRIEKFQHLRNCLTEKAAKVVEGLDFNEVNYDIAVKKLQERFDNKRLHFQDHIREIFEIGSNQQKINLRDVLDTLISHTEALNTLGTKKDLADGLLVYLVLSKVDLDTATKWEETLVPSKLPTFKEMITFLDKRCQFIENIQFNKAHLTKISTNNKKGQYNNNHSRKTVLNASDIKQDSNKNSNKGSSTTIKMFCRICSSNEHFIQACSEFVKLTPIQRFNEAKRLNLCINCLKANHLVRECNAGRCRTCYAKHHSMLHINKTSNSSNNSTNVEHSSENNNYASTSLQVQSSHLSTLSTTYNCSEQNNSNSYNHHLSQNSQETFSAENYNFKQKPANQVFLATSLIQVKDSKGSYHIFRALLDSGSQVHFVTTHLANCLSLRKNRSSTSISGISASSKTVNYKVNLIIKSCNQNFEDELEALVLPKITVAQPNKFVDISCWNIPSNIKLADPQFNVPQKVDLLIGASLFFDLLAVGQIKIGKNLPTLQKTSLGWIVAGTYEAPSYNTSKTSLSLTSPSNELTNENYDANLDEILKRFWEIEAIESTYDKKLLEFDCEKHFIENFSRLPSGKISVRLPFTQPPTVLGNSVEIAKRQFFRLESRLRKLPTVRQQYIEFIREYLDLNHMEYVPWSNLAENNYFFPHHCVLRPESSSTKLRVVFNGSQKTQSDRSLNEILAIGPVIQDDLFTLLIRFRTYKYAVTADISKMYRQVEVKYPDTNFQHILWRESPKHELKIYRLKTVTYGTTPASYLATRALQQVAEEEKFKYPLGSTVVKQNFYYDDLIYGCENIEEALKIRFEVEEILKSGGFPLHKWCSNSKTILDTIPPEKREKFLKIEENEVIKTLGLIWQPNIDIFRFTYTNIPAPSKFTKRSILSTIAKLFDPLGLLNPVIFKAKLFISQLWQLKIDWDESLPQKLISEWLKFFEDLKNIDKITFPRYITFNAKEIELHAFSDGSAAGYGTCIYIKTIYEANHISVNLLTAKSRVAPTQKLTSRKSNSNQKEKLTVNRLELNGALLMVELTNKIISILDIKFSKVICWTDSTTVLWWIKSTTLKLDVYVKNRVSKIRNLSKNYVWKHIETAQNPADLVSRGSTVSKLIQSKIWFNGPPILIEDSHYEDEIITICDEELQEISAPTTLIATKNNSSFFENLIFLNSFCRLQRAFAYALRFVNNIKFKIQLRKASSEQFNQTNQTHSNDNVQQAFFTTIELENALSFIVKILQQEFIPEYYHLKRNQNLPTKSNLKSLAPFMDCDGIIRVGGRLSNANLNIDQTHQILLPKHPITRALMAYYHFKNFHCGSQTLLCLIRTRFWPISGKHVAKNIVFNCVRCFRHHPRKIEQFMGELPAERVLPFKAFLHSGVDFFGPFYTTQLVRGRAPVKAYGCIYVCFSTKAVHIDIVSNLTTEAFLASLKRFVSRRGRPAVIFSDNATNFTGANNKLLELKKFFELQQNQNIINDYCSSESISWKFIPPRSPHFGALWESSVKMAKERLNKIIGSKPLTYEELHTLFVQTEAIVNSRPLCPISDDPNDLNALTPAHFLIGGPIISIPEPALFTKQENFFKNENLLSRWQRVTLMHQQFWSRWHTEYLHLLQHRFKWSQKNENIKINTMVLIAENNLPPAKWCLGRIVKVLPGDDGLIRTVMVRTQHSTFPQPIAKLCPLPTSTEYDNIVPVNQQL